MKYFLPFLFVLMVSQPGRAQSDTVFQQLNHEDQPVKDPNAPRYAVIHPEKDRWKKVVFDAIDDKPIWGGFYADAACRNREGAYSYFNKSGRVITTGKYSNNKKEGVWKTFSDEGKLLDSAYYSKDYIQGLALSWHTDGSPRDSSLLENDGNGSLRGYYANGFKRQQGSFVAGKKQGRWTYFEYKTGTKIQEVEYTADSAISYTCYDAKGNVQTTNCIYEREAAFKGGDEAWIKYLIKGLSNAKLPRQYNNGEVFGTVIIQFVVNTEGKTTDIKVLRSVHPDLDEIAVSMIQNCPKWVPAIQYNQPVKAYRKQPITFPRVIQE